MYIQLKTIEEISQEYGIDWLLTLIQNSPDVPFHKLGQTIRLEAIPQQENVVTFSCDSGYIYPAEFVKLDVQNVHIFEGVIYNKI